ncbi:MAG: hypothetical protein AB7E24_14675 [Novosphingobium sp.]
MRHFVTIDANWYTAQAGEQLQAKAASNVRMVGIESGLDFRGLELKGEMVPSAPGLTVTGVADRLQNGQANLTRIMVSQDAVADISKDARFDLLVTVTSGKAFEWAGGGATASATVSIDEEDRLHKVETTIIDVLQDLMIANSSPIQAVVEKYLAAGGRSEDIYRNKADFARRWHETNNRPTLIRRFEPDRYAALSPLVRGASRFTYALAPSQAATLGRLWISFMCEHLREYFLTAAEACGLIINGSNRRNPGRARNRAGTQHGDMSPRRLLALLSDPQQVPEDDCYILCICNRSDRMIGKKAALFGWKDQRKGTVKDLRLLHHEDYERARELVAAGQVTPLVLFLKKAI